MTQRVEKHTDSEQRKDNRVVEKMLLAHAEQFPVHSYRRHLQLPTFTPAPDDINVSTEQYQQAAN